MFRSKTLNNNSNNNAPVAVVTSSSSLSARPAVNLSAPSPSMNINVDDLFKATKDDDEEDDDIPLARSSKKPIQHSSASAPTNPSSSTLADHPPPPPVTATHTTKTQSSVDDLLKAVESVYEKTRAQQDQEMEEKRRLAIASSSAPPVPLRKRAPVPIGGTSSDPTPTTATRKPTINTPTIPNRTLPRTATNASSSSAAAANARNPRLPPVRNPTLNSASASRHPTATTTRPKPPPTPSSVNETFVRTATVKPDGTVSYTYKPSTTTKGKEPANSTSSTSSSPAAATGNKTRRPGPPPGPPPSTTQYLNPSSNAADKKPSVSAGKSEVSENTTTMSRRTSTLKQPAPTLTRTTSNRPKFTQPPNNTTSPVPPTSPTATTTTTTAYKAPAYKSPAAGAGGGTANASTNTPYPRVKNSIIAARAPPSASKTPPSAAPPSTTAKPSDATGKSTKKTPGTKTTNKFNTQVKSIANTIVTRTTSVVSSLLLLTSANRQRAQRRSISSASGSETGGGAPAPSKYKPPATTAPAPPSGSVVSDASSSGSSSSAGVRAKPKGARPAPAGTTSMTTSTHAFSTAPGKRVTAKTSTSTSSTPARNNTTTSKPATATAKTTTTSGLSKILNPGKKSATPSATTKTAAGASDSAAPVPSTAESKGKTTTTTEKPKALGPSTPMTPKAKRPSMYEAQEFDKPMGLGPSTPMSPVALKGRPKPTAAAAAAAAKNPPTQPPPSPAAQAAVTAAKREKGKPKVLLGFGGARNKDKDASKTNKPATPPPAVAAVVAPAPPPAAAPAAELSAATPEEVLDTSRFTLASETTVEATPPPPTDSVALPIVALDTIPEVAAVPAAAAAAEKPPRHQSLFTLNTTNTSNSGNGKNESDANANAANENAAPVVVRRLQNPQSPTSRPAGIVMEYDDVDVHAHNPIINVIEPSVASASEENNSNTQQQQQQPQKQVMTTDIFSDVLATYARSDREGLITLSSPNASSPANLTAALSNLVSHLQASDASSSPSQGGGMLASFKRETKWRDLVSREWTPGVNVGKSAAAYRAFVPQEFVGGNSGLIVAGGGSAWNSGKDGSDASVPQKALVEKVFSFIDSEKTYTRIQKHGIPNPWRGHIWYHLIARGCGLPGMMTELMDRRDAELIRELQLLQKQESLFDEEIAEDVASAMPNHVGFMLNKSSGQMALKRILHALSLRDPDVGYTTAMSKIGALLLLFMEEERAYLALVHMYHIPTSPAAGPTIFGLSAVHRPGLPALPEILFVHDELMRVYAPRLSAKLASIQVKSIHYATHWYLNLFLSCVAFPTIPEVDAARKEVDEWLAGFPSTAFSPPQQKQQQQQRSSRKGGQTPVVATNPAVIAANLLATHDSLIPFRVLLRVWDLVCLYGLDILCVVGVALLRQHEAFLHTLDRDLALSFLLPNPTTPYGIQRLRLCRPTSSSDPTTPTFPTHLPPIWTPEADEPFIKLILGIWNGNPPPQQQLPDILTSNSASPMMTTAGGSASPLPLAAGTNPGGDAAERSGSLQRRFRSKMGEEVGSVTGSAVGSGIAWDEKKGGKFLVPMMLRAHGERSDDSRLDMLLGGREETMTRKENIWA